MFLDLVVVMLDNFVNILKITKFKILNTAHFMLCKFYLNKAVIKFKTPSAKSICCTPSRKSEVQIFSTGLIFHNS